MLTRMRRLSPSDFVNSSEHELEGVCAYVKTAANNNAKTNADLIVLALRACVSPWWIFNK